MSCQKTKTKGRERHERKKRRPFCSSLLSKRKKKPHILIINLEAGSFRPLQTFRFNQGCHMVLSRYSKVRHLGTLAMAFERESNKLDRGEIFEANYQAKRAKSHPSTSLFSFKAKTRPVQFCIKVLMNFCS